MATLTRLTRFATRTREAPLDSRIPEPFPTQLIREQEIQQEDQGAGADDLIRVLDPVSRSSDQNQRQSVDASVAESSLSAQSEVQEKDDEQSRELLPSIVYVQQSCLMTLNNLFLELPNFKQEWQPIVPPRRHSMPSRPAVDTIPEANVASSSSALQTLVSNLRNYGDHEMLEASSSADDAALIRELQRRVEAVSFNLSTRDAGLARALTSLLAHINRLSVIDPKTFGARLDGDALSPLTDQYQETDVYSELRRQLSDLQVHSSDKDAQHDNRAVTPVLKVEIALIWTKIDQELETVLTLCRERAEATRAWSPEHAPPDYDETEHESYFPPEYEQGTADFQKPFTKPRISVSSVTQTSGGLSEKMKLDLDAVTMAIDRLYLVAPQLHNQRVELKTDKLEELERARLAGQSLGKAQSLREGKGKERDMKELEKMVDLIGKASSRRMVEQSVTLDGDVQKRLEKAQRRENQKREAFVEHLLRHSGSRRLHSQDAVLPTDKVHNPETMLTLPEFIREQIPEHLQTPDPEAMMTLPEFVKEPPPERPPPDTVTKLTKKQSKSKRHRSLSAPPLAWLLPSRTRSSSLLPEQVVANDGSKAHLTVRYVAEHHENLQHVLVFLGVDGMPPGIDLEAEVPSVAGEVSEGETLILRCGTITSVPLTLPVRVVAGKQGVRVQSGHYEVKLSTCSIDSRPQASSGNDTSSLLDSSHLSNMAPTSFICASCSLPLVQSSSLLTYHDLPSEYWSELLDAWMCHTDQKLHQQVATHGQGFWPQEDQALVGGSYVLFNQSAVVRANIRSPEASTQHGEEWRRVGCICGAVVGRCQSHPLLDDTPSMVFRLAKYAIRPVSPTAEPCRLPFSAFILEDMMELVHAHATYRFIILDEEDEKPRLLIWLFKPKIRLAYATTAQYVLPKSDSMDAAKVLFKILGPDSSSSDLNSILDKYPGFPQAERLIYPIDICRRLAGLLKESNTSYPIGMRVMTGLLVGWLHRS